MRKSIPQNDEAGPPLGGQVTEFLRAWSDGDRAALDHLTPIVYDELHRLAQRYMKGERPGHSLQTTALVNEAYMRLVDYKSMKWQNRAHFFAVSAQLMRRILVDHARSENRAAISRMFPWTRRPWWAANGPQIWWPSMTP